MAPSAPQLLLATLILLPWLAVAFALGYWRGASRSTAPSKRRGSHEPTASSPDPSATAAVAQLATDQAALFSTLEKLTTTVKRLSSRNGMRELREERSEPSPPPVGAPKAELLRFYGMSGKVGPAFAQAQLDLEASSRHH